MTWGTQAEPAREQWVECPECYAIVRKRNAPKHALHERGIRASIAEAAQANAAAGIDLDDWPELDVAPLEG